MKKNINIGESNLNSGIVSYKKLTMTELMNIKGGDKTTVLPPA